MTLRGGGRGLGGNTPPKWADYVDVTTIRLKQTIFAMVLSSRSPRHDKNSRSSGWRNRVRQTLFTYKCITFYCHTPKIGNHKGWYLPLPLHSFCSGRRGVVSWRHLSVGAYTRERILAFLLCAKRASGVRNDTIPRHPRSTHFIFGVSCNCSFTCLQN